jgi:hypothetical protein
VKEVFEGQTVSTQMNTIILWAMYGTAIAVMANLMAFLTYLFLNDQDDWGKQLMITAKARIRAWKSRSHRRVLQPFGSSPSETRLRMELSRGNQNKTVAVLEIPLVDSPESAVKVAIASKARSN